ncbi:uncharacterized protein LOC131159264 isoform X2 [Malania oleifera]|uniref:uncharacterized protein LOC131159264 isoform X2 n=1 Tax=Malania oleifera TaxID=397392 RepID=UPI0025ADF0B6|nr:uncharacterized protein LOC131159264 isoform X2 [Malania oleifera]
MGCALILKLPEFAFPHIVRLWSYHWSRNSHLLGLFALHCNNRRNYSSQNLLEDIEPTSTTCTAINQIPNHPPGRHCSPPKFFSGEAYSVLQSSGLQHWFKNWQEQRRHKLTASTFGGAVGFWPRRRVQLWLEKLGAIEPFTGNLATCWSNIKEEEALERYKLITGNAVLFPEFQVYGRKDPKDNWLAASPDGAIDSLVYGLPSRGVLEIKCPFFNGDMRRASPWSRVPLYCMPQAQGLMEIMDRDWMDFYVWTPKGSSLFRLYRDSEYWDVLKIALSDFWWKHVQPARDLCNSCVISNPLTQLKSLRPAPRHELCNYIVYESKRLVYGSKLLVREIHGKLQN